jgi:flagellar biosynthesis regulator FlbT
MNFMEKNMENESHVPHQKTYETLGLAADFVCDQASQASTELKEINQALKEMKEASLMVFADLEGLVRAQADFLQSIKQLLTYSQDEELLAAFRLLNKKQTTVTKSLQGAMKLFEAQDALSVAVIQSDGHLASIHKVMAMIQTLPLANIPLSAGAQLQNQQ